MATEFKPEAKVSVPLPLEKQEEEKNKGREEVRIWVGNMDPKMNEYSLLQLLKQFNGLKSFEILYHKAGEKQGQSKGFGFATYISRKAAESVIKGLNNRLVMRRHIQVRWANEQSISEKPAPAALTTSLQDEKKSARSETAIEAIERKLREMENRAVSAEEEASRRSELHPLLQQARVNKERDEAIKKKRMNSYKPYKRHRRR